MRFWGKCAPALLGVGFLVSPALATSLPRDGKIVADCAGFTITFYGSGFEAPPNSAASAEVGYTVTLTTSDGTFPYVGTTIMNYGDSVDPLWSTNPSRPSLSLTVPWRTDVCGEAPIVSGGEAPNGMYFEGFRVGAFTFNWDAQYPDYGSDQAAEMGQSTSMIICECGSGGSAICRTPGFWGTHAGVEKKNAKNITQAVLDEAHGVMVCGVLIDTTVLKSSDSALESMCVSPKGDARLQLVRQLTAAALNCTISGDLGCEEVPVFGLCNDVCLGLSSELSATECIDRLDCLNNGGQLLENGMCQLGTCGGDGVTACEGDRECAFQGPAATCVPTPGNCHDNPLVNEDLGLDFDPPGAAGSSNACNSAIKNNCDVFNCR
ncbi:MAG: hypothetical protein KBD01_01840 [Acidobacteria bacterium]|nr:hypothetical protein [Acidobacteriota bacterium]